MKIAQGHSQQPGDQDSLAPVQSQHLSVEDEASLMNRGRGRQIAGLAAVVVALAIALGLTLRHLSQTQAYADAAAAATDVETHFEGYFLCALPGASASQLSSGTRVQNLFERIGDRLGKGYAATLRSCHPRLEELSAQVAQLPVPEPLATQDQALSQAVTKLGEAETAYQRYLDDASTPYDFARALPHIEKMGLAFGTYRQAYSALRDALHAGM